LELRTGLLDRRPGAAAIGTARKPSRSATTRAKEGQPKRDAAQAAASTFGGREDTSEDMDVLSRGSYARLIAIGARPKTVHEALALAIEHKFEDGEAEESGAEEEAAEAELPENDDDRTFINDVLSEDEASAVEPAEMAAMAARAPRRIGRTRKRARCEECGERVGSCECEDDLSLVF
jgi:TATA-binding protein-associated factor Taf7